MTKLFIGRFIDDDSVDAILDDMDREHLHDLATGSTLIVARTREECIAKMLDMFVEETVEFVTDPDIKDGKTTVEHRSFVESKNLGELDRLMVGVSWVMDDGETRGQTSDEFQAVCSIVELEVP